ncbi:MAG: helix-turn-helix domain-containing protein [Bacillota bacterium]
MREIGELLRKAREANGLAVSDVQEATKIRSRYLEAMEEGDFDALPGEVYVRGFLRTYAEAVGLSGDEVVERYKSERARIETEKAQEAPPARDQNVSKKARIQRHLLIAVGAVAIVAIATGVAVWRSGHVPAALTDVPHEHGPADVVAGEADVAAGKPASPSAAVALPDTPAEGLTQQPGHAAAPAPASQAAPSAAAVTDATEVAPAGAPAGDGGADMRPVAPPREHDQPPTTGSWAAAGPAGESRSAADGHEISVVITERCWVRVVADGKVVFERSMLAGEEATWRATKSIRIKVGNASGIHVTYNGVHLGALGKSGQVIERTFPEY